MIRTNTITIRVTPQDKADFQKAAKADGRTVSDWAVRAMREKAGPQKKEQRK